MVEEWIVEDPQDTLKREYESRGAEFPYARVDFILSIGSVAFGAAKMSDLPRNLRKFKCDFEEARESSLVLLNAHEFLERNKGVWKAEYPELLSGIEYVRERLNSGLREVGENDDIYKQVVDALERNGWVVDRLAKKIKATQTPGAGNRPRMLKNELICLLYGCLRSPFEIGWPKEADIQNPQTLRNHISQLLSYCGMPTDEIDPRSSGPIWNAIQNHLK